MRNLLRRYEASFLLYDFYIATAISAVLVGASVLSPEVFSALQRIKMALNSAMFALTGTLIGFVMSTASVMLAYGETERFRLIRESGMYRLMFDVHFNALRWLVITTVTAFLAVIFESNDSPRMWPLYLLIWSSVVSAARISRCVWILKRLADIATLRVMPESKTQVARRA